MKICSKCHQSRDELAFRKRKKSSDGLRSWCKTCDRQWYLENREAQIARVRRNNIKYSERAKDLAWLRLIDGCIDCGETDPTVLTFDHRDAKVSNISDFLRCTYNDLEGLKVELAKCDVRCANCHHRKTAKEQQHWTWLRLQALVAQQDNAALS